MKEKQPKRFTEEELKQLSELAKSGVRHTLTENDFEELNEQKDQQNSQDD